MTTYLQTRYIRREMDRSIRYSIFQQWSILASFNEPLDFPESSLQATYGHLLVQASYRQFDRFSKQRFRQAQRFLAISSKHGTVHASCSAAKLLQYCFSCIRFQYNGLQCDAALQVLGSFAISERKRCTRNVAGIKRSSDRKQYYPPQFKHLP